MVAGCPSAFTESLGLPTLLLFSLLSFMVVIMSFYLDVFWQLFVSCWGLGYRGEQESFCLVSRRRWRYFSVVHPCEVPHRCRCYCVLSNQCYREKAFIVMPWNWIRFMFNCKVKLKKMRLSLTTLQWKFDHSLPSLDFKFGRTVLI